MRLNNKHMAMPVKECYITKIQMAQKENRQLRKKLEIISMRILMIYRVMQSLN